MKNILVTFLINVLLVTLLPAQIIPYGTSQDSAAFIVSNNYGGSDTVKYEIFYYKPLNYDSLTSPILLAIHGSGADGSSPIGDLQAIADRRKALIVAPTVDSWVTQTGIDGNGTNHHDSPCGFNCTHVNWLPHVFKGIYHHVLFRETRDSIPVHFIGFSAGGQLVTRYMLIRQVIPDSIPIVMAVSSNPFYYIFCTDTLNCSVLPYPPDTSGCSGFPYPCPDFNAIPMPYSSGLSYVDALNMFHYEDCDSICPFFQGTASAYTFLLNYALNKICNEHVIQYYNENYAVLIGTLDTTTSKDYSYCVFAQGKNRYERAQNFYAFSDSDAVVRGTTLKWQYGAVPGVAHNQNLMYNTILAGDSMPLAERLLFETPYHTVPSLAPLANFAADTTIVSLPSATVQFYNNSINASSYLWDFGDTTNSAAINPSHTYLNADTFTVRLTAISGTGCENKLIKKDYIIVKLPVGVESFNYNNPVKVIPNPSNGKFTLSYGTLLPAIYIYNYLGKLVFIKEKAAQGSEVINLSAYSKGIYFIKVQSSEKIFTKKVIIE